MSDRAQCSHRDCDAPSRSRGLCHRHYMAWHTRQHLYGRFESVFVDAAPVRDHVHAVMAAGMSKRRVAAVAGVDRKRVGELIAGRSERGTGPAKRIRRDTADRLLAIPIPSDAARVAAPATPIPAVGTQRRLQALVASGWTITALADHLDGQVSSCVLHDVVAGKRRECLARTATAVAALFDRLQLQPGPSQRAAARGRAAGWALPLEWDEESIDDPTASPVSGNRWSIQSSRAETREQIMMLTDRGMSARDIADELGTTERQVARVRAAARVTVAGMERAG